MKQPYILVIEDDSSVCALLFACLSKAEFRTTIVETGEEGLRLIEERPPDLLILDLNLPGMNGLDVCRSLRRDPWTSNIPVMMLTAQSEEQDVIDGLEVGADDYMTKPFSPKLLVARVQALLRRTAEAGKTSAMASAPAKPGDVPLLYVQSLGYCDLRLGTQNLPWGAAFSAAQRQLLSLLISARDARASLEEVQASFWPDSSSTRARSSLDTLLSRVRRTLEQGLPPMDSKQYLVTRRGFVSLQNCHIDAQEFLRLARKGLQRARARNFWQAELAFSSAFSLWQGPFLPGGFGCDQATALETELEHLYLEAGNMFARILAETGRAHEAIKQLRSALRYCPTDDETVRLLYLLSLATDQPAQASQFLHSYREALQRGGFSADEIRAVLSQIPTEPPTNWLTGR